MHHHYRRVKRGELEQHAVSPQGRRPAEEPSSSVNDIEDDEDDEDEHYVDFLADWGMSSSNGTSAIPKLQQHVCEGAR